MNKHEQNEHGWTYSHKHTHTHTHTHIHTTYTHLVNARLDLGRLFVAQNLLRLESCKEDILFLCRWEETALQIILALQQEQVELDPGGRRGSEGERSMSANM